MNCQIEFPKSILRWEDALPLGNGKTGCLIWGTPSSLRFSLDRGDLWDRTPPKGIQSPGFTYENMVRLVKEGKTDDIRAIFDAPYNEPTPTRLHAGRILLQFPKGSNTHSVLDLQTAEAFLTIESKETSKSKKSFEGVNDRSAEAAPVKIHSFLHAILPVGFIAVDGPSADFHVALESPKHGLLHYPPAEGICRKIDPERQLQYFTQRISDTFSFGIVLGIRKTAMRSLLIYQVVSSDDGAEYLQDACTLIASLLHEKYSALRESHYEWWAQFRSKSKVRLPDKTMEKNWILSNYFLAGCSREGCVPMTLQGVWTADTDELPPWKGDYHHDLNTEMSYAHYLKANRLEEGRPFWEFLWKCKEEAASFASGFYHTRGICLPSAMTIDALPLGGWPMYSLSPTNQIWLCQSFVDYWRYTDDAVFLKERAYPYLTETARCLLGLLEERDGKLYLPVSSSPEIHDDTLLAFLTPNSNYDLSLLRYLFIWLERFADLLSLPKEAEQWKKIIKKLPTLAVNEDSVLMLSPAESLTESHRHLSHAHAIYPLRLLSADIPEERRIIEATVRNLEMLGTSKWIGYTFTWMAQLYAILHNGEKAAECLQIFWSCFCGPNGFHLNGDQSGTGKSDFTYCPFTLEGNMGAADALQEMLLQMQSDTLELFPAIPEKWARKGVSFTGLRAEHGILVDASLRGAHLQKLRIYSPKSRIIRFRGFREDGTRDASHELTLRLEQGWNTLG